MQAIGPVRAQAMFGGHGIYLEQRIFGLVADSVLYLKVDKENESHFKVRGLEVFSYMKKGAECKISYYQAPEEALEEAEVMSYWANLAYSAALRAASKKTKISV